MEDLGGDEEGKIIVHTDQYGKKKLFSIKKTYFFNKSSSATVSYGHPLNVQSLNFKLQD